jgi:hypothetical protein
MIARTTAAAGGPAPTGHALASAATGRMMAGCEAAKRTPHSLSFGPGLFPDFDSAFFGDVGFLFLDGFGGDGFELGGFAAFGHELEGDAVDAETTVGGSLVALPIKDVSEVGITAFADGLDAMHATGIVDDLTDIFGGGLIIEGGPATAGVELLGGGEELGSAADAVVGALALLVELLIGEAKGTLGSGLAGDSVLLLGEFLFPFGFRFNDNGFFRVHGGSGFGFGRGGVGGKTADYQKGGGEGDEGRFHGIGRLYV